MKTLISIIGNIKTGKSTIANLLSSQLNIPVFNFQLYREKYESSHNGKNDPKFQNIWNVLIHDISKQNVAILDSSGVNSNEQKIHSHFERKVIIRLDCPRNLSWSRLNEQFYKMQTPGNSKLSFSYYDGIMNRQDEILKNIKSDFAFDTKILEPETIASEITNILELIKSEDIISESKKINPNKIKSLWHQVFKGGV